MPNQASGQPFPDPVRRLAVKGQLTAETRGRNTGVYFESAGHFSTVANDPREIPYHGPDGHIHFFFAAEKIHIAACCSDRGREGPAKVRKACLCAQTAPKRPVCL